MPLGRYPQPTAVVQYLYEKITEWLLRSSPLRDQPLNIRPGMIFATAAWMILLGVLGMAPLPELPVNDKALHFFGLGFATFLLYFVVEVPEGPGRRIWFIRKAPLLLAGFGGFIVGGIISEFFQALLPWKEFQWGDIAANLLGSTIFLYLAHLLHVRSRRRQELSTFYQPLSAHHSNVYRDAQGRSHAFEPADPDDAPAAPNGGQAGAGTGRHARNGSNVWEAESEDERASVDGRLVFELGDDEDEREQRRPQGQQGQQGSQGSQAA